MNYYQRQLNEDGSFENELDRKNQMLVKGILRRRWNCDVIELGQFSPVDFLFMRNKELLGVGELKCRSHSARRFKTVFLNHRKYHALTITAEGLQTQALFIVQFIDQVRWIRLKDVDPTNSQPGGCLRIVKANNDMENVIHVPVDKMSVIRTG